MVGGVFSGLAVAVFLDRSRSQDVSYLSVPLAGAAGVLVSVVEAGDVDLGQGNRNDVLALLPQHFPFGDETLEVFLDLSTHDVAETGVVGVDLLCHYMPLLARFLGVSPGEY